MFETFKKLSDVGQYKVYEVTLIKPLGLIIIFFIYADFLMMGLNTTSVVTDGKYDWILMVILFTPFFILFFVVILAVASNIKYVNVWYNMQRIMLGDLKKGRIEGSILKKIKVYIKK